MYRQWLRPSFTLISLLVYHTSTPEPMASHKEAVCEVKFSETDMTAFTSNNKSISSPPNYSSDEEGSRPLNFVHEVQTSVGKLLVNNNGKSICCSPSEKVFFAKNQQVIIKNRKRYKIRIS